MRAMERRDRELYREAASCILLCSADWAQSQAHYTPRDIACGVARYMNRATYYRSYGTHWAKL